MVPMLDDGKQHENNNNNNNDKQNSTRKLQASTKQVHGSGDLWLL